MEKSKYDRATLFLKRINHIDHTLVFIHEAAEKNLGLRIERDLLKDEYQTHRIVLDEADIEMLIHALEKDKKDMEEAFKML